MTKKIVIHTAVLICCFLLSGLSVRAETISGMSSIELTSPVTPALKEKQRKSALDSLSSSLSIWINDFFDNCLDPNNPISKYFLDKFTDQCKQKAKEESLIEGRELTIEYYIPSQTLDEIIIQHNAHYDSRATDFWKTVLEAQKYNQDITAFEAGMKALFYSMAHIGSPLDISSIPAGTTLTQHLQTILQKLINRVEISFSEPIITGMPPNLPQNNVTITVTIDTLPFPNFPLITYRPNGKEVIALKTNTDGSVPLSNMKIPFVARGAFLYIRPKLGALIDPTLSFEAKSFGLKLNENVDQTLIFNIIKPVFSLEYTASSVNQTKIPSVFSDKTQIQKFLTDSLHLQPATGKQAPDIAININCQISSYTYDEREQTQMKVETKTVIRELEPNGSTVEKVEVINDKYYDVNHEIPIGLFFWQSSNALRDLLRRMLDEL